MSVSIFQYLANTNTINFLIMALLLVWICKKINLKISLNKSIETVKNAILNSENEKTSAKKNLDDAKETLKNLPKEINTIETLSKEKIDVFKKQVNENTKKTIEAINANIDKVTEIEEKKISNAMTKQALEVSVETSKNKIIEKLASNPELHEKFIDESLKELENIL
ncbi:hypothetical protein J6G99_05965 [bacterium]|nr:hypothetical protein [bacterium]